MAMVREAEHPSSTMHKKNFGINVEGAMPLTFVFVFKLISTFNNQNPKFF
jgi:hypothetical protein